MLGRGGTIRSAENIKPVRGATCFLALRFRAGSSRTLARGILFEKNRSAGGFGVHGIGRITGSAETEDAFQGGEAGLDILDNDV